MRHTHHSNWFGRRGMRAGRSTALIWGLCSGLTGCAQTSTPMNPAPQTASKPCYSLHASQVLTIAEQAYDIYQAGPHDGQPVLLLNPYPPVPGAYQQTMQRLANHGYRPFVALAKGPLPAGSNIPPTVKTPAQVLALANALGLHKFHIAGSQLAWDVARYAPARILSVATIPRLTAPQHSAPPQPPP